MLRQFSPGFIATVALLVVVTLADWLALPRAFLATVYAVPMVVAPQVLSPRGTAAVGMVALAAAFAGLVIRQDLTAVHLVHLAILGAISVLCYLLAARVRDVQEAVVAQRSLEDFLAMVAHDLRAPITTVLAYAQMITRPEASSAERVRNAMAIQTGAREMNRLAGDLIDAARIGAGTFQVQPERVDLVALARRVAAEQQATTTRHRIVVSGPGQLVGSFDPGRLAQVVTNLVGNAIKYSPNGGEIDVRISSQGDNAVLSVSDEGIGIKPEALPNLFRPYWRERGGRARQGAGLGLFIAKGIVEAHGGRIWAASEGENKGSVFTVMLPLRGLRTT